MKKYLLSAVAILAMTVTCANASTETNTNTTGQTQAETTLLAKDTINPQDAAAKSMHSEIMAMADKAIADSQFSKSTQDMQQNQKTFEEAQSHSYAAHQAHAEKAKFSDEIGTAEPNLK